MWCPLSNRIFANINSSKYLTTSNHLLNKHENSASYLVKTNCWWCLVTTNFMISPHWYFSRVIDFHSVIMSGPGQCFQWIAILSCARWGSGGQPVWTGEQQRGGWMRAMTLVLSLSKTVISISVVSPGPWQTLSTLPTLFNWTSTGLCH